MLEVREINDRFVLVFKGKARGSVDAKSVIIFLSLVLFGVVMLLIMTVYMNIKESGSILGGNSIGDDDGSSETASSDSAELRQYVASTTRTTGQPEPEEPEPIRRPPEEGPKKGRKKHMRWHHHVDKPSLDYYHKLDKKAYNKKYEEDLQKEMEEHKNDTNIKYDCGEEDECEPMPLYKANFVTPMSKILKDGARNVTSPVAIEGNEMFSDEPEDGGEEARFKSEL